MNAIVLSYKPRKAFVPFHLRSKRFAVLVCHRRAGKTVAAVNELVSRALHVDASRRQNPKYAYVAPYRSQAKDIAWTYLKDAVRDIPGTKISEAELYVKLPNSAVIKLYGADDPDSLRGGYFDGVILDEYGDMKGTVFSTVIRPMLADRKGWCVFMGTPKGKNAFYDIRERARQDPNTYFYLCLKASESGHLAPEELQAAKQELEEDEYEAEFECSFEAAIKGSYYAKYIAKLELAGQITDVPVEEALPVYVAMDIGHRDATVAWFYQIFAGEIRVIDHYENSNISVDEFMTDLEAMTDSNGRRYRIEKLYLPHDAKAKTFASGKSVIEQILAYGYDCELIPRLAVKDGIAAVRKTLPLCWFDIGRCYTGVEYLKAYQRKYDQDRKVYAEEPLHDASSHSADAFRYLCLVITDHAVAKSKQSNKRSSPVEAKAKDKVNTPSVPASEPTPGITLDQLWACQRRAPIRTRI